MPDRNEVREREAQENAPYLAKGQGETGLRHHAGIKWGTLSELEPDAKACRSYD